MLPGRSRHESADVTSPAYLRTTASYAEFLEKQRRNDLPSRFPENIPGMPPLRERDYHLRLSSWREDALPPRGPFPPRPEFREQGWRNEPSWRSSSQPGPSRTESWIKRQEMKSSPVDAQRYIAPASEEPRRHIAPAAPPNSEMWRDSRAFPPSSNWRKEPADLPPRRHFDPSEEAHRNGRPDKHRSPRELPPSPKQEQSPHGRSFSGSPAERHRPRRTSPPNIPREFYSPPREKRSEVPRVESPVRNRILPAEEVRPIPGDDEYNGQKWGDSPPKRRSRSEFYDDAKPNWRNTEPPRPREESWTVQYKKRVEAQKAAAMMRDLERRKGTDTAGPSFDTGISPNFGREYQRRSIEDPIDDLYGASKEENSSTGRKFFFADTHQKSNNFEDHYGEARRKDSFDEPAEYRKHPKDFYPEDTKPVTTRKREHSHSESTINPNDYVEEFNDDDWNELGAWVNNQSRKRLSSSQDPSTPNKKPYTSSSISESGFSNYSTPSMSSRKEIPQSSLSFFREELPSIRSLKGFSRYPSDYPPQRSEFPPRQRWESSADSLEYNGDGSHGYGYR